jgi:hypothetical protein
MSEQNKIDHLHRRINYNDPTKKQLLSQSVRMLAICFVVARLVVPLNLLTIPHPAEL